VSDREEIAHTLSERITKAPRADDGTKRPTAAREKTHTGTWKGRQGKTSQDRMPVEDRPRVKAAQARLDAVPKNTEEKTPPTSRREHPYRKK